MPLTTTGLVCRYFFDAAASGQTPTQIDDASPNGYHLTTLNYGGSNLNFVETSGNRGLESTATAGSQRASRAIDNTSDALRTALEGVQKATIALVLRVDGAASGGGRIFGINGRAGQNGELVLKATNATNFQLAWNDTNVSSPVYNFAARSVLHLVIDTTQATQADRVRYSIDGGALTSIANTIAQNSTLALGSNLDLICFNRESTGTFDRSFDGVLYYAALHAAALTQTEIDADYAVLATDDDTPAGGGENAAPTFPGPNIANKTEVEGVAMTPDTVSDSFSDGDSLTFSAIGTWPAGITVTSAGVIQGTPTTAGSYTGLQVRATDTAAQTVDSNTFSITVNAPAAVAITTEPLKNNTGTVLASETGATVHVYETDGTLVVTKTAQTTDASGIMVITDAALVAATEYRIVIVLASGAEGMARITAA